MIGSTKHMLLFLILKKGTVIKNNL